MEPCDLSFLTQRFENIVGWFPGAIGHDGSINPHVSLTRLADGRNIALFHAKPVYYETVARTWRPLSEITTYHGNHIIRLKPQAITQMSPRFMRWLQQRQRILKNELVIDYGYMGAGIQPRHMAFATDFYPDFSPETVTVDGGVATQDSDNGWANVWGDTTGQYPNDDAIHVQDGGHGVVGIHAYGSAGDWNIVRGFYLFNTGPTIGASDTISSASLWLWYNTKLESLDSTANAYMGLTSSNPASNTALVAGDIDNVGSTELGTGLDITGITTGLYSEHVLNASGIANIAKGSGVSKFAERLGLDINNVEPATVSGWTGARAYSADNPTQANDPKLAVVFSSGGGVVAYSQNNLALLGVS
jgi:hypothetical protein